MKIHETVIISGKGGTGKTSLTASLIPFCKNMVLADCDVDAPDLDILLSPTVIKKETFNGMDKAQRQEGECSECGLCVRNCRFHAVAEDYSVIPGRCEGCGVCTVICPDSRFRLKKSAIGSLFESETEYGPMIHARLYPGEENAGKLVSEVRRRARKTAEERGLNSILIDGPPGTGCSVISSITGTDLVIVVTEPTVSGLHDLKRVYDILQKFSVKAVTIINKYGLSESIFREIEKESELRSIPIVLKLPFTVEMTESLSLKKIPSLALPDLFRKAGWNHFAMNFLSV